MNLEQAQSLDRKAWHKLAGKLKPETRNFIGGKFVAATKGRSFKTYNPATGEGLAEVTRSAGSDVDAPIAAARTAFNRGVCPPLAPADRPAPAGRASGTERRCA